MIVVKDQIMHAKCGDVLILVKCIVCYIEIT